MLSLLIGILAATGASTLYSLGIGVQAIDARATSQRHTLRISLLGQLLRRGRWLAGTAMTALGWPLQIVALLFVPLEVVQPALAIGLLVLLALGERMLGERPGRRELTAVCAIVAGVVGIAALAPDRTTQHVHGVALVLVLTLLGAAALAPFVAHFLGRSIANLTMIAAGLAFAWGALATKLVADAASGDHWLTAVLWGAAAITASVVGLIAEMSSAARRDPRCARCVRRADVRAGDARAADLARELPRLAALRRPARRMPARAAHGCDDARPFARTAGAERQSRA
jgi:drug/metabolite transporter (DMT)-like permease